MCSERAEDGEIVAEVAHLKEALLRAWPRLDGWLRDEREFLIFKNELERSEKRWRSVGMVENALATGLDLARAEEWLPKRGSDLSPSVTIYIQRSIASDRAQKERRLQFQRRVSVGAIAAAGILTLISAFAWFEWQEAAHQRDNAAAAEGRAIAEKKRADVELKKTQVTQSLFLADLARKQIAGGDFVTATLLALAGSPDSRLSPSAGVRPYVPETEGSLYEGFLGNWERLLLSGHAGPVTSVAVSPDDKRIVTGSGGLDCPDLGQTYWPSDGCSEGPWRPHSQPRRQP